jgi:Xaa-Pro aminopeptidase
LARAGRSAADKIAELQKAMRKSGQDAAVLTLPDSICWLLNVRGADVAHNPVVLAFAILPANGKVRLYVDAAKVGGNVRGHLRDIAEIHAPAALMSDIAELRKAAKRVRVDANWAAWWFKRALGGSAKTIIRAADPCILPKARKNEAELAGARAAHERDGVAVTRFLAWLDREAASGRIDEMGAASKLEALRSETGLLKDLSFDTISGAGPNGAIVHYRVNTATNRKLKKGELFLIDSGGQYEDGTTDITRTVAIAKPTEDMRRHYTLVLKGHIAVATARFPTATPGVQIDAFARQAMWAAGLDFDHGTGHGIGSFLSVHEGPQSISRRGFVPLEAGMIVSNEPGYYKTDAYGIRLENLLIVTPPAPVKGGERDMMGFETITLAPFDPALIDAQLLTVSELDWLNAYHARVAKIIAPHLDATDRAWLKKVAARIAP